MANAPSMSHPLKEIFRANKVALGLLTRLARSGDIARIAKTTGHDFVFIDAQHAAYNIETIRIVILNAIFHQSALYRSPGEVSTS